VLAGARHSAGRKSAGLRPLATGWPARPARTRPAMPGSGARLIDATEHRDLRTHVDVRRRTTRRAERRPYAHVSAGAGRELSEIMCRYDGRPPQCNPAMVPLGLKVMMTTRGPSAQVTGTCSRSNWPFRANVGAPWLRYVPSTCWQEVHAFGRGSVRVAFIIAGSSLPSTAVNFPAARSAMTWPAWDANGPADAGEVPAPPLPQAARKHTTASGPSAAAQPFMAQFWGRINKITSAGPSAKPACG
jgi:hypothetical protein